MSAPAYSTRKAYYTERWQRMDIPSQYRAGLENAADRILAHKSRYLEVSRATGVPWFVIGCIHYREGSCNFGTHLHNGDPLTGRTRNVPAGRPVTGSPPFTWEASAQDALDMRGLNKVPSWELERCLYEWEAYNGWGYEQHQRPSPYLWSKSAQLVDGRDVETKGKYVRDHVYDPNAVDMQDGCAPLLKVLMEKDTSTHIEATGTLPSSAPEKPSEVPPEIPAQTPPATSQPISETLLGLLWRLLVAITRRLLKC